MNVTETPSEDNANGNHDLQAVMNNLNLLQEEVGRLLKGKPIAGTTDHNMVNYAHFGDFSGINYNLILSSAVSLSLCCWILDSGATNHICRDMT